MTTTATAPIVALKHWAHTMRPPKTLHTYRCTTYPCNLPADQVELCAAADTLQALYIIAPTAEFARASAATLSGQCVHTVVRIEVEEAAA